MRAKNLIGVWIYVCGLGGSTTTAVLLSGVIAAYPANQIETFGPVVPGVARVWSRDLVPNLPTMLGACSILSALIGIYLWRSRRPVDTRLFAAAVIAALNLFLAMFCLAVLMQTYFYLPRIANAG